jgi:alpha-1,2-mannosyltransferase
MSGEATARDAVRQWARSWTVQRALILLGLSIVIYATQHILLANNYFTDLKVYRAEGNALRHGIDLYGPLPGVHGQTTYPPFAAVIFVPVTFVPIGPLKVLSVIGNLALLVWVSIASCRLLGLTRDRAVMAGCTLAAGALWCEPVWTTFSYGQINLLLLALVLWDFNRAATARTRGIGVGLAAAIKVTPAFLIVYLVLTRRFRFAAVATVTLALTMGVTALIDPHATWNFWTHDLFDPHRVGRLENAVNQTIRGMLVRMDHTRDTRPTEKIIVLVVLVIGLACAVAAYRVLGEEWGLPAAAITGLLVSPISWSHHWVWCIPVAALLWFRARVWILPTIAVFCSFAVWAIPHTNSQELHLTHFQIAVSGWYVLFGLGFFALTAVQVRRAMVAARPVGVEPGELVPR